MGTDTVMDKIAKPNTFLSILHFQAGIKLSPVSYHKDLFDMENIKCVSRVTERYFQATSPISMHALPPFCFPVSVSKNQKNNRVSRNFSSGDLFLPSQRSPGKPGGVMLGANGATPVWAVFSLSSCTYLFHACRELLLQAGVSRPISEKVPCTDMQIPVGILCLSSNKYFWFAGYTD